MTIKKSYCNLKQVISMHFNRGVFLILISALQFSLYAQSNFFGNYIVSDNFGNTYVGGNFKSSALKFGSFNLINSGGSDIYIAKYNTDGKIVWAKSFGGRLDEKISSLKVDSYGNLSISGTSISKEIKIDDHQINCESKVVFGVELNGNGDFLSSKTERMEDQNSQNHNLKSLYKTADDSTLSLILPKTGDNWKVGAKGVIEWNSLNVSRIIIELSTNNGNDWKLIYTSDLFNFSNEYDLIVPNTPSDSCLIKISDYYNAEIADTSGLFSISGILYWQMKQNSYSSVLRNIYFFNSSSGWAAGFNGLMGTTDKGKTWFSKLEGYGLLDIFFLNNNIGWTVGLSGTIFKTADGGTNWIQLKNDSNFHFEKVFFADENNGYMIGKNYLLKTTDGGDSWEIKQPTDHILQTMCFINKDTGWVAGNEGVILKTTDAGSTWNYQQMNGTNFGTLTSLYFLDKNTGWVSGSGLDVKGGVILKTLNGGDSWSLQHNGYNRFIYSVFFTDANSGWAVGDEGIMFNTTDGGSTWELQGSGTFADLFSVNIKSLENGWTVGDEGTVLNYNKGSDSIVLPVELTSFKAESKGNIIKLDWITSTELNNKGFEIERKISGEWETIGFIKGKGTTTSPNKYYFTDNFQNSKPINIKYRLKQIDFDGSYKYSNEIGAQLNTAPVDYALLQNYPNPFNPSTFIKYSLKENARVILKIYDILGREVVTLLNEEKQAGTYSINFNAAAEGLSSGTYLYVIKASPIGGSNDGQRGEFIQTRKMILLK